MKTQENRPRVNKNKSNRDLLTIYIQVFINESEVIGATRELDGRNDGGDLILRNFCSTGSPTEKLPGRN